jgi:hypothetical protein
VTRRVVRERSERTAYARERMSCKYPNEPSLSGTVGILLANDEAPGRVDGRQDEPMRRTAPMALAAVLMVGSMTLPRFRGDKATGDAGPLCTLLHAPAFVKHEPRQFSLRPAFAESGTPIAPH